MPDISNLMAQLDAFSKTLSAQHAMMLGIGGVVLIVLSLVMLVRGGAPKSELGANATKARQIRPSKRWRNDAFLTRLEKLTSPNA